MAELFPTFRKDSPRSGKDAFGEDSSWQITLSDLTLLLLCSLVVWHVVDKQVSTRAQGFSPPAAALRSSVQSPIPAPYLVKTPQVPFITLPTAALPLPAKAGYSTPPATDRWQALREELEKYTREGGWAEGIGLVSTQHELLIDIKEPILFASGKADLRATIFPILTTVATLAQNHLDLALEVQGHTDDVPIATPEFPSNWELSAARASRVARALIEAGVAPARITAQGYASFHPLLPNTTDDQRAINRRVEIRLYRSVQQGGRELDQSPREENSLSQTRERP
ncbi:MAG: flagellar motor protein MotB [Candidatus Binatia bacterium]